MYTLDLDKCKNLPACRGTYNTDDSYCALGKLFYGLGLTVPTAEKYNPKVGDFIVEIARKLENWKWAEEVSDINDSPSGSLTDNHEKAFRLAVNYCVESRLVKIETKEKVLV